MSHLPIFNRNHSQVLFEYIESGQQTIYSISTITISIHSKHIHTITHTHTIKQLSAAAASEIESEHLN